MFDIGMPELMVIFVVALLVLGPDKLPELAKTLGKGLAELKKAFQDVKDSVEEEFKETTSDIREAVTDVKKQIESEVRDTTATLEEAKKQVETESEEINKTFQSTAKDIEDQGEHEDEQTVESSDDEVKKQS